MKRIFASLLAIAAVLLTPSCLEYETNITLNKDGSGTITEETVFNAEIIGMLEMGAQQGGQAKSPLDALKDPEKAKAKAKDYGEGVTFVKIEEIARNGGKGVRVTYKFADINKISINPGEGLTNLAPGTAAEAKEVGTATTFDVVAGDGAYVGGVIAPGVNLSLAALEKAAAKLPRVAVDRPERVIEIQRDRADRSGRGLSRKHRRILGQVDSQTISAPGQAPIDNQFIYMIELIHSRRNSWRRQK